MFSLNDNWDSDGENELHRDAATYTSFKTKLRSLRKMESGNPPHNSARDEDVEKIEQEEAVRSIEDIKEEDGVTVAKSEKGKQKRRRTEENRETPSKRKKAKLVRDSNDSIISDESQTATTSQSKDLTISEKKFKTKKTALHSRMASKMEGARFRWINEQLYTTTGHKAKQMFDEDPSLFDVYHAGFATQVSKWPLNPLDKIITHVKSLQPTTVIADFGCGEARLAQSVPHTVHSFDLIAANRNVVACDMAHVPLAKDSVDLVVFCLSLMGSNVSDFIREARRVLKKGGLLKICEIASRIESVEGFVQSVESFGFKLVRSDTISKMFLDFEFKATFVPKKGDSSGSAPCIHLNPCIYKRR